jgi:hypothetical protein
VAAFKPSPPYVFGQQQSLHGAVLDQVALNDLLDVFMIDIGVPLTPGINDHDWPSRAAVQTSGLVDSNPTGARQAQRFDLFLAKLKRSHGVVLRTGALAFFALIQAKENMVFVIRILIHVDILTARL